MASVDAHPIPTAASTTIRTCLLILFFLMLLLFFKFLPLADHSVLKLVRSFFFRSGVVVLFAMGRLCMFRILTVLVCIRPCVMDVTNLMRYGFVDRIGITAY